MAQRVVEPQSGPEQDAIAGSGQGDGGARGDGRYQGQQGQRPEAGSGSGALDDVQRIERQGHLQQKRASAQHERRDKRASHLLQELPGRVHARPTRTRGAAHRGGRLQAQMCHLGLKEVLSGR